MKQMAIVPWSDEFKNDQSFNLNNNQLNRDNCLKIYSNMKKYLFEHGWEVHTRPAMNLSSKIDGFH